MSMPAASSQSSFLNRLADTILDREAPGDRLPEKPTQLRWKLFLTSFTILYFELVCIRWIPAYVRYMGYFMNFILLASFLGIGVGILFGQRRRMRMLKFPVLLFLLILIVAVAKFEFRIQSTQVLYYGAGEHAAKAENWLVLPVIFSMVTLAFVQLSRPLGVLLTALPPLQAYATDILGSLAGTAAFFFISYFSLPPIIWFLALSLLLAILYWRGEALASLPFLLGSLVIVLRLGLDSSWSPYYRIQTYPSQSGGYIINVNSISHQEIITYTNKETFYFRAYDLFKDREFENVLVIGAGAGSDVSIALHNGAQRVEAVEIDPVIYRLGKEMNPDRPYDDPRVSVFIDDGRAFLRNNTARYDLIVFALPDSLTLTSGFANLRLESFLLTTEAFKSAREHLNKDGILVLYNYYRLDWLVHKLAGMLESTFGQAPYVTTYGAWGRAAILIAGPGLAELDPAMDIPYTENSNLPNDGRGLYLPMIGHGRMQPDASQALATDDWPFVYMPRPTVPCVYLNALGAVLVIALVLLLAAVPGSILRHFEWHFFFLGAAFMLLETRSLVTFALLFGTTWMVNSLVFFAILSSVLLAVLFNARFRLKRIWPFYACLFGILAFNYVLPQQTLLGVQPPALRYTLASLLTFTPIFLANVVFSHSFRESQAADLAFGSNLLGAMLGGVLEYLALAFGYQFLLLPVMGFYALAFVVRQRN